MALNVSGWPFSSFGGVSAPWIADRRTIRYSAPIPAGRQHGIYTTYTNYGCRCELCKKASATVRAVPARWSISLGIPSADRRLIVPSPDSTYQSSFTGRVLLRGRGLAGAELEVDHPPPSIRPVVGVGAAR